MSYYYVPDKVKPICNFCKYTLGAPFWIVNSVTDDILSFTGEKIFCEPVTIDVTQTGGTIPADIRDFEKLREVIRDMKEWGQKTYS